MTSVDHGVIIPNRVFRSQGEGMIVHKDGHVTKHAKKIRCEPPPGGEVTHLARDEGEQGSSEMQLFPEAKVGPAPQVPLDSKP
jgi:hypothetical protein